MNTDSTICLIGDIFVDLTIKSNRKTKLRLGGIVHSARALWALDIPYDVCYFAPSYLDEEVKNYLTHHGCVNVLKLGNISGTPNVMLINEEREIGDQGYEYILRDAFKLDYFEDNLSKINERVQKNYLLISGNYELSKVANHLTGSIHVDVANNVKSVDDIKSISTKLATIFLSTSSDIFKDLFQNDFVNFASQFQNYSNELVLKENRGGSRSYKYSSKQLNLIASQPRSIIHSVGVGDVFDAAYVSGIFSEQAEKSTFSSWIAAEYAVTSFPDDFKVAVGRILKSNIKELAKMPGISLPWEKRHLFKIYIAGPDFSFVNRDQIDILEAALKYHNFSPHRPVKENGQMEENATKARKQDLVAKDINLLDDSSILIAVLLYDDPGTLIEIGYAKAKNIPTIVYDPFNIARNCMLTELPDLLTGDLEEVITDVFLQAAKILEHAK